jgi:16S rRNA processing protein RimM
MSSTERLVRAGTVGRPHGLDGGFHLSQPAERLSPGAAVRIAALETTVERLGGTAERPLVRVRGVATREAAAALRGEPVLVSQEELAPGEYFASDLVGMRVAELGTVRRVVSGPSCDVLEVGDEAVLIPFIRDAVRRVDTAAGTIEVDLDFLGLR